MQERSIIERIQVLEQKASTLEGLPARVGALELQILQFREEVRVEFSAVRGEISAVHQELVELISHTTAETRREARVFYEDLKQTIKTLGEGRRGT